MVKLAAEDAPAKINLFLRVTGRRPDGYHELDSIFVPVSLADRIVIESRPASEPSVTLDCDVAALADPDSNLAARAARALMQEFAISEQVRIRLTKKIPVGAGLGGGSSDAGTVLRMLSRLWRINDRTRLSRVAIGLGADVPFFLDPRPSRVQGIGEMLMPLENFPVLNLIIAVPPIEVSTAAVFRALKRENWSGPAPDREIDRLRSGEIAGFTLINDLAPTAMKLFPEIAQLKAILEESGAVAASMTGSGSAVFGIFKDGDSAASASNRIASIIASIRDTRVFTVTTRA